MIHTYTDLRGNAACLTDEEIAWFGMICCQCQAACQIPIPIECSDHDQIKGHKNALGIFYTDNPDSPFDGNTKITIDNYFIHECYEEQLHHGWNMTFETLEHVIAHEFAHAFQLRHCKRHRTITEELFRKIKDYQKSQ